MTISADLVKQLRDKTGAGMMDCKKALAATEGDIENAIDWLRKKGLAKAGSKSDRIAAEGLVGISAKGNHGVLVEVNSETDFVARNVQFQEMVRSITSIAGSANGDVATLLAATYPGKSSTVEEQVKEMIATIGENMNVRRTAALEVADGLVTAYVHNKAADDLGRIGVLVALESKGSTDTLSEIGRQIAMHVAARNPVALDLASVPQDKIDREKAIIMDKNQGKPAHVLEKIAESALKTFAKENCLLEQAFVIDESKSVAQALKDAEKAAGAPIKMTAFVRYGLGEGIEKPKDDFASEVAGMAKT
ncbi:MAG: translation elongation factor Ts [Hyphomicrobium aestuarii]|nr:translation elongation factor Ts [Hyphomicrobium aestuarii]